MFKNSNILVSEMIEAITNRRIKVKEVADFFGVSERTIQKKIKGLGYTWNPVEKRYELEEGSNVDGLTIDEAFKIPDNNRTAATKPKVKTEVKAAAKEVPEKQTGQQLDRLDELLQGKKKSKKYVGFYAEADVLSVLDNVEGRIKSELINEALRVVFKQRGLL